MKKLFYICLLYLIFTSCSKEELPNMSGIPASLTLSINAMQNDINTRAVSPDIAETRIFNFYVFVFNKNGSVDYQKFYLLDKSIVETTTLSIPGLTCESGKSVVVISNIATNNSIVDIPEETLNAITTRDQLNKLTISMYNQAIERATSFLSSGTNDNVTVNADGATQVDISLKRVDAKIRFNITTADDVTFTPTDWRIRSIPNKIYVMDNNPNPALCIDEQEDCFDSNWAKFEDGKATFAFYSMEHLPEPTEGIPSGTLTLAERYALREKQDKNSIEGGDKVTNGKFKYAPQTGSYVEMRGNVLYKKGTNTISADVVYTVHLGAIGDDVNDYKTHRNTFYTYNVNIKSVTTIEVEVDNNEEDRPGAEGNITEAQHLLNLDAHYGTFKLELYKNTITDNMRWNVSTPFSKGDEQENSKDYKWIYFKINDKNNSLYNDAFRTYPGEHMVYGDDIIQLSTYIADINRNQDKLLNVNQLVALLLESKTKPAGADDLFDANGIVKFTAFVNENYYETDPNNPSNSAVKGLWKTFTNQQQRVMNILSEQKYSSDQESSKSEAIYSIRQHAIQTMYNRSSTEDFTAWGLNVFQNKETVVFDKDNSRIGAVNTDTRNGRQNTIYHLNLSTLLNRDLWSRFIEPTNWSMKNNYDAAKYRCLSMNRDNNGDSRIQESEVQWYLAAIDQLTDIWIGEWSYDPSARLYKGTDGTEQFFVSSTVLEYSSNKDNPRILWSSEGSSTGPLTGAGGVTTQVYYRCIRNLGITREANPSIMPDSLATYDPGTATGSGYISLKRLDEQSIRATFQKSDELPVHHEREASNKPYKQFEVRKDVQGVGYTWNTLYALIQRGERLCPTGYRVPNQRELALMLSLIKNDNNWKLFNHFSRTSFQFDKSRPGFSVSQDAINLYLLHGDSDTGGVRCVRDMEVVNP